MISVEQHQCIIDLCHVIELQFCLHHASYVNQWTRLHELLLWCL